MSKRRNRKKWKEPQPHKGKRVKADEVFQYGSLTIARFGRYIQFSNKSTPEEHEELLKRAAKAHKEIETELEKEVSILQSMVGQYDPVELMHRTAYMVLPLFLKYRSENEFSPEESYALPTLEYIQYLIARTPVGKNQKEITEPEFDKLWAQATKVMKLTGSYLTTRTPKTNPPTEIDLLRYTLDSKRLMVRVKRYTNFLADYLRSSLEPYDAQLRTLYGVGVDEIIKGIKEIEDYQRNGVTGRYKDMLLATAELVAKMEKSGLKVEENSSENDKKKIEEALKSDEFKQDHADAQEKARLTLTSKLFDITDLTSLPKDVLKLLSVKPGESVLEMLTGPGHDDLSPISPSVLHYKPFLEVDDRFYFFYHSGFEDNMAEIIETELQEKLPKQIPKMEKAKSDSAEQATSKLLESLINPDFLLQNIHYPNPDQPGNLTELDILMGVDDVLFLIEVKSGGFSGGASRGAPKDLASTLSDLIIEGQRQSERAERYIKSSDEVDFFDETGKKVVHHIKHQDYRRIFRIVVTKEDLGWVGAKLAQLSILDPNLSKSFPWHVSIDDLRVVVELFNEGNARFIHYLEQRLIASSVEKLTQHDEIEHIALYNAINHYHELPIEDVDVMSYDASYMRGIDYYFAELQAGESPVPPMQEMPDRMKRLVEAIDGSELSKRFELASSVLSLDSDGRKQIDEVLEILEKGQVENRQITLRMPITSHFFGMSFSVAKDSNWEKELVRSAAQMDVSGCTWWLVVQIQTTPNYKILKIEKIEAGRFSEEELAIGRAAIEQKTQEAINAKKIGRNETCPCGSGKKFKKCHGALR